MTDHGSFTPPGTLRFERLLPGPIETVWAYLVEPDLRAQWLAGGEMDLKPGGKGALIFRNGDLSGPDDLPSAKYAKE
ncbi:MAG TPA: ATPase, partial [Alphaproteobacteria bacterium]|nr:ATPase [Alphaproteobacteria bacterium]